MKKTLVEVLVTTALLFSSQHILHADTTVNINAAMMAKHIMRFNPPPLCIDNNNDGTCDTLPASYSDWDVDGVANAEDFCDHEPGTRENFGCPDSDGDGLPDDGPFARRRDSCPLEAGPPETQGCPDTDGDGIADRDDRCPSESGPELLRGCPDRDGDGIADFEDACPDEMGDGYRSPSDDDFGCPLRQGSAVDYVEDCSDGDGDGVLGNWDLCPDVGGELETSGCPANTDSDGDGVINEEDICPLEPGSARWHGCVDYNGDGVLDCDEVFTSNARISTSCGGLPSPPTDESYGSPSSYETGDWGTRDSINRGREDSETLETAKGIQLNSLGGPNGAGCSFTSELAQPATHMLTLLLTCLPAIVLVFKRRE